MYLCAVAAPFLGSLLAGLAGRWLGARGSGCVAVFGLGWSAFLSARIYYEVCMMGAPVILNLGPWFQRSTLHVNWILNFDALSACMMVTVTFVSFCVHLYTMGYMQADPHLPRFLSYLSLFTGSMLLLVTCNDLLTMLVGWEMIGVCSYLLIGFWFHRLSATKAAQKAMLVNRVSDTGLLLGLLMAWWYFGSTDYAVLTRTRTSAFYADWVCLALLAGALGKSAQVGLHVWLRDRMEGPTPVSALIHAATLVTAGVYLVARTSALWECSLLGRSLLVWVGAVTSLMAASLGLVQNDLKRVIAYSTCSQLGYMMVSLGLSHYGLAIFHLMTHACFKALLFLGAGVLIHRTADVQDLRRQGGAHSALPWAWTALSLGSLSLMGWPFLAGYYSKDAILELSWATPGATGLYAYSILMIVASLTRAYSFRVLLLSFVSSSNARKTEQSKRGLSLTMGRPLAILAVGSIRAGYSLNEGLIGWGSSFWANSIGGSPATVQAVSSHMIPVWASYLPLTTVPLGLFLAFSYLWPLPLCAKPWAKRLYLFLQARMQFDLVWNQRVAMPVLTLGAYTLSSLDKGVLEVLGPRGITLSLYNWAVPSLRFWQSGAIHDYALVLKVCVILGLVFLALPSIWMGGLRVYPRALRLSFMLRVLYP
uniref:NADH-ubiquinone oxidoreductase chain 5 n=1 Tax=Rotundella rotunda TaxID=1357779 RepID=A0A076YFE9_9CHLO|nr:NADH dehydrogenase subunit 5 [Rotundella rotunda]